MFKPMCRHGKHIEDTEHYLLNGRKYQHSRDYLTDAVGFSTFNYVLDTLLFGDRNLDNDTTE